jgi:hypothetical protein
MPAPEMPADLLWEMPKGLPKDRLGGDIALMLHRHPEIKPQFADYDLAKMTDEAKRELLEKVRTALGIQPVRRRRHVYVGP